MPSLTHAPLIRALSSHSMSPTSGRPRSFRSTILPVLAWFAVVAISAAEFPPLSKDFGPCPTEANGFLRYIVQRRAAEGLNRMHPEAAVPKDICAYGGSQEDSSMAWIAAAAYRYEWSRFHKNDHLRNRALLVLDCVARIHADGKFDDGGLNAFFGPEAFAWAALSWIENGGVDAARAEKWKKVAVAGAEDAMEVLRHGSLSGQYANPEMYYLSALAATWKLTGDMRYKEEAARALRRFDNALYPGGGMAYFLESAPQHGYQHMVVKSVALYWNITGDPYAKDMLRRLAPYYPDVQHRSGLMTDAEQSNRKHTFYHMVNPATPAMLAVALGDGANRTAADIAASRTAENVDERTPSFGKSGFAWLNYGGSVHAAVALRLMERGALPEPTPLPARRVFPDGSYRGVRTHWDDFTAVVGTRQMNDSLAGAYLADPAERLMPLESALDGVFFEVLQAEPGSKSGKQQSYRCVEWSPIITTVDTAGFSAVGCLTRLCDAYWANLPRMAKDAKGRPNETSDWTSLQYWAVWRDHLVGLGTLTSYADGGTGNDDVARIRWRLV